MAVALETFVIWLIDAGAIAPRELENFVPPNAYPKDAEELARQLVESKRLTSFRVREICRGRGEALSLGNLASTSEAASQSQETVPATSPVGTIQDVPKSPWANSNLSFLAETTADANRFDPTQRARPRKETIARNRKIRPVAGAGILGGLILLAGVIFEMQPKDGRLVVEINQPDAVVQVLDDEGKVEISQLAGMAAISISIDPGKRRLKVEKDGFQFFASDFDVESGGTASIKATLQPAEKPAVRLNEIDKLARGANETADHDPRVSRQSSEIDNSLTEPALTEHDVVNFLLKIAPSKFDRKNPNQTLREIESGIDVVSFLIETAPIEFNREKCESIVQRIESAKLTETRPGAIELPADLQNATKYGSVYLTHRSGTNLRLFETWAGKGRNFRGYLYSRLPYEQMGDFDGLGADDMGPGPVIEIVVGWPSPRGRTE